MRVFKNKAFSKWAASEGVTDVVLLAAVEEISSGLVDADLGGQLYKKRVALDGRGKRGGVRTLLAYRAGDKAFFIYCFAKNSRANIDDKELKALRLYAKTLLNLGRSDLEKAANAGELIAEVCLAIEMGCDASDIGLTVHPHPTLSET